MNFDFSDDQKQLRDEARKFLAEKCSPKASGEGFSPRAPLTKSYARLTSELPSPTRGEGTTTNTALEWKDLFRKTKAGLYQTIRHTKKSAKGPIFQETQYEWECGEGA